MNHPSKLSAGDPVSRNWRTTNESIDVGRDLDRRVWDLEIKKRRTTDSPSDWVPLVPALLVPGYAAANDGSDGRRFYVPYALLNGVRVKGTLEADGTMGEGEDAPTLIEMPSDAVDFVVYIYGRTWAAGVASRANGDTIPDWAALHCCPEWHFVNDDDALAPPEIQSDEVGSDGAMGASEYWPTYPCQPDPVGENPTTSNGATVYKSTRQPFAFPLARIQPDTVNGGYKIKFNGDERMDVWFEYVGTKDNGAVMRYQPFFHPSVHIAERAYDDVSCDATCDANGSGGGGGSQDDTNANDIDQIKRTMGNWLYRVLQIDALTVGMLDGLFWTGGGDDPQVVSWGGAELAGTETEDNPAIVALKVDFSGLCEGPVVIAPSIAFGVGQTVAPSLATSSKQPSGWPDGFDVNELDSGTIYLPIAEVYFDSGGKMAIKEKHRGHVGFLLALKGGKDGGTGDAGKEIPMHHAALVCGRVQEEIYPLLDDAAFTVEQAVGDIQVTLDSSASPTIHYKVQKKFVKSYLYRGIVAYEQLDDSWTNPDQTIDGTDCSSS